MVKRGGSDAGTGSSGGGNNGDVGHNANDTVGGGDDSVSSADNGGIPTSTPKEVASSASSTSPRRQQHQHSSPETAAPLPGATALMGLFAPPRLSTSHRQSASSPIGEGRGSGGGNGSSRSLALTGLFAPPKPTRKDGETVYDDGVDRDSSNDKTTDPPNASVPGDSSPPRSSSPPPCDYESPLDNGNESDDIASAFYGKTPVMKTSSRLLPPQPSPAPPALSTSPSLSDTVRTANLDILRCGPSALSSSRDTDDDPESAAARASLAFNRRSTVRTGNVKVPVGLHRYVSASSSRDTNDDNVRRSVPSSSRDESDAPMFLGASASSDGDDYFSAGETTALLGPRGGDYRRGRRFVPETRSSAVGPSSGPRQADGLPLPVSASMPSLHPLRKDGGGDGGGYTRDRVGDDANGSLGGDHTHLPAARTGLDSLYLPVEEYEVEVKGLQDRPNGRPPPWRDASGDSRATPRPPPLCRLKSMLERGYNRCLGRCSPHTVRVTFVGSMVYTLFSIVFCLALASAVNPKNRPVSLLGPLAKLFTIGTIATIPLFVSALDIPAMYPGIDVFLAPFIAQLATGIEGTMQRQSLAGSVDDDMLSDAAFLTTLTVLVGIGLLLTTAMIALAARIKLANLGAFLPYAVLCGFFSAVGITLWTLAISIDTGGLTLRDIISSSFSGDFRTLRFALVHHLPSVAVGIAMYVVGPRNPLLVPLITILTVAAVYCVMLVARVSLHDAQHAKWFWTKEELVYSSSDSEQRMVGVEEWAPPAPFGVVLSLNRVNLEAVKDGLPTAIAMALIFFLRVYLHATAVLKATKSMLEQRRADEGVSAPANTASSSAPSPPSRKMDRGVSDESSFSVENHTSAHWSEETGATSTNGERRALPSLNKVLRWYGISFAVTAFVGGSAVCPSIAIGSSMFKLGADGVEPQYGAVFPLLYFYLTDFKLVVYIPKMAFSCLLVVSSLEILVAWFFRSFKKISHKLEWSVVPLIVIFSYVIGVLESVALGVALSTLIFVAAFYRTGVVKFIANGLMVRSNIERTNLDAMWLDQNGDLIQVIFLQNYLFFGNASSCLKYIQSMFEEPSSSPENLGFPLPPLPRYLIIGLNLVTGMDASAVDILMDTLAICKAQKCKVYLAGMSHDLRAVLSAGGLKANNDRNVRIFPDFETALGKAEDGLLKDVRKVELRDRRKSVMRKRSRERSDDNGFRYALEQIDEQHDVNFAPSLAELGKYTVVVEIKAGQCLFESHGGVVSDEERGLFFIEHGLMRVERDPSYSLTRSAGASLKRRVVPEFEHQRLENAGSIGHLKARTATVGKMDALMKGISRGSQSQNFRLARIGPGWVVGSMESCSGLRKPGLHVAVTPCRLHHLPYDIMAEIEDSNPAVMLRLFKLLAHTLARRHDVAVEQLATLHSIVNASPPTKPVSRTTAGAINRALLSYQ